MLLLVLGDRSFLFDSSVSFYTYITSLTLTFPRQIHPQLHNENLGEVLGPLDTRQDKRNGNYKASHKGL